MSVEIYGPKGYDYQYLNSLLVALEYLDRDDVEVYIEKKNEEDAQIRFNEEGRTYTIDLQAKSRTEEIGLADFSDWISHFESLSAVMNLLNKINNDNDRFVIFVSNVRCSDDVSSFIESGEIHSESNNGLNNDLLNKIRTYIYSCYADATTLSVSRRDALKSFIGNLTNNKFRKILKRIKIREKYTKEYTIEKITSLLNKKYYIPQSIIDTVITELTDEIRNGRDCDRSISSDLIQVIDKYSGKYILNKDEKYIRRTEKELCEEVLNTEKILLLTGVSFCGKTYLAKDIAEEYLNKGYKVEITGELHGESGANSFIKHRSIEDRLLILEDPFGQVETRKDAISICSEIRSLIRESKSNRKIIITSRKDIILDTMSKKTISECSIDSHNWIDLTLEKSSLIPTAWGKYFENELESKNLYEKVTNWLLKIEKTSSLQLGHIANIYNSKKSLRELMLLDPSDIVNLARIDSNDLARIIEGRGSIAAKVFIALGLSCNTYKSVNINDLAFILSSYEENPSINEDSDTWITYSFGEVNEAIFPQYSLAVKISDEYKTEIKYLNQHGYIEFDNLKRIMFVHPIYHYATQLLFKRFFLDVFEQQEVLKIAQQSLSSLSKNANLCTLTMVENVYKENPNAELKTLMLRSLKSIFPSVRDRVIMFFDRRINDLDELEQTNFVNVLKHADRIVNDGILWHQGTPWFNPSKDRGFHWFSHQISEDEFYSLLTKTESEIALSAEEMWNLLNVRDTELITIKGLEKASSYDESFIREKAIRLIFKNYAFEFAKLDNYLDDYEHPDVIYGLFRGALDSWSNYSNEAKRLIIEYYKKSLNVMSVSIRSKKFLENFEDEHSDESIDWSEVEEKHKKNLWCVWHEVFIEFLNKFPSRYIKMNEPHMVEVTEHSLKYIKSEEKVVELATAWFNWLERYFLYNLPDDFGMSVAQYLIDGTKNNSNSRESIFKLMLLTDKTSFITSNVRVFINSWEYLSDNEKVLVLDLLTSNRNDIKWIKAVALNSVNIPSEVQIKLLGESIKGKDIAEVVDMLIQKDILEQCLNIHCGYPQPLWWNGYHHNNYELWDAVIVEVLKRNTFNRGFNIALREVIELLYDNDTSRINHIYDLYIYDLLKEKGKRKVVFQRLLCTTIDQNQCNKKVWDLLFQHSTAEEKEYYYDMIVADIELIQYQQLSYKDLFSLFDKSVVLDIIYPRLAIDSSIRNFGKVVLQFYKILEESRKKSEGFQHKEIKSAIQKFNDEDISKQSFKMEKIKKRYEGFVIKKYKDNPPRLSLTNNFVGNIIKEVGINSSELIELIEMNRKRLINITSNLREKYSDHYKIENWV
ncbi:hypothetical protein [Pelosinus baikalensis]|uniref:Novel STAND NTPase 3 domain-containing protein n=1 Tax=Pelosinus baikalensis TaxID=2892015 RepID=A0ABS8I0L1_9FIRM|nr:hypothetical protein [Pelosinus baikalensis]MCC5468359.1 hypothetical protein [Pelosinus baikalensis]